MSFFYKKEIYLPTKRSWFILLGAFFVIIWCILRYAHPFLALEQPLSSTDLVIVEGWMSDDQMQKAAQWIEHQSNDPIVVTTGSGVNKGLARLIDKNSYAAIAKELLSIYGVPAQQVVALPSKQVRKDRTRMTAQTVSQWLAKNPEIQAITLISEDTHARRSFMIFRKYIPQHFDLGVISLSSLEYEAEQWWTSSEGVRAVLYEGIACLYVFLFYA